MDADLFHTFSDAMDAIEAEEMLRQIRVAQFPYLQKSDQQKLHRELHRKAYPAIHEPVQNAMTTRQLGERLKAILRR